MMNYSKQQEICPTPFPIQPMLAHAYVPYQCLSAIYPPNKALYRATIFPELDQPEYEKDSVR